jgi:hypothetical protein
MDPAESLKNIEKLTLLCILVMGVVRIRIDLYIRAMHLKQLKYYIRLWKWTSLLNLGVLIRKHFLASPKHMETSSLILVYTQRNLNKLSIASPKHILYTHIAS